MPSGVAAWAKAAKWAGRASVARAVLVTFAMSIGGCIIPTPLERVDTMNNSPRILTDEVMPSLKGPLTHSFNDMFSFTIVANDDDTDQNVTARILLTHSLGGSYFGPTSDITLMPAAGEGLAGRRSGEFPALDWCLTANPSDGLSNVLVAVSDHGFTGSSNDDQTPMNNSDRDIVSWVLQCM